MSNVRVYGLTPLKSATQRGRRTPIQTQREKIESVNFFSGLEEDIEAVQNVIDGLRSEVLSDSTIGVYRGKITSKKVVNPIARQLSQLGGHLDINISDYRVSSLSESLYNLVQQVLGGKAVGTVSEQTTRMLVLKSRLQELYINKVAELAVLSLVKVTGGDGLGDVKPVMCLIEFFNQICGAQANQGEVSRLNLMIKDIQRILGQKEERITNQDKEIEVKGKLICELQKEIQQNKSKDEVIGKLRQQIVEIQKHLEEYQDKCRKIGSDYDQLKQDYEKLKIQLDTQYKEQRCQILELETTVKDQRDIIDDLKKNLISGKQEQDEQLQQQLRNQQSLINKLTEDSEKQKQEIEDLQRRLDNSNDQQEKLYDSIKEYQEFITKLKENLKDRDDQIKNLQNASEYRLKYDNLLAQTANFDKVHKELTQQNIQQEHQIAQLVSQLQERLATINEMHSQIKSLQSELQTAKRLAKSLEEQLFEGGDEDTYENVMKHELAMMRKTYEARLKELRDEMEEMKRQHLKEINDIKKNISNANTMTRLYETQLKSLLSI